VSPSHGDLLIRPSASALDETEARAASWCHEQLLRWRTS
jgi:hypothetical protein